MRSGSLLLLAVACGAATPIDDPLEDVCSDGECVCDGCGCPDGQHSCDGECVDLSCDGRHCGGCGNACPDWTYCSRGACMAECETGGAPCNTNWACCFGRSPESCCAC